MTKFGLTILMALNDNGIDSSSKALSISQITSLISEKMRKSYSTTYRHLCSMAACMQRHPVAAFAAVSGHGAERVASFLIQ